MFEPCRFYGGGPIEKDILTRAYLRLIKHVNSIFKVRFDGLGNSCSSCDRQEADQNEAADSNRVRNGEFAFGVWYF